MIVLLPQTETASQTPVFMWPLFSDKETNFFVHCVHHQIIIEQYSRHRLLHRIIDNEFT